MRKRALKPEYFLSWHQEAWGGAEMPVDPPERVRAGVGNRLARAAVQKWTERPYDLRGVLAAVQSLDQQRDVQGRMDAKYRREVRTHLAGRGMRAEWPKGADARNHTYWKWMEWRARAEQRGREMEEQWARDTQEEAARATAEAVDTHPWAHREDLRRAWRAVVRGWREPAMWRSLTYACWLADRGAGEALPVWMRRQTGGKRPEPRERPRVEPPDDYGHEFGRNVRLREVFEGYESRAEQQMAVRVMETLTGGSPTWMTPRLEDPSKRRGRPRKVSE